MISVIGGVVKAKVRMIARKMGDMKLRKPGDGVSLKLDAQLWP